MPVPEKKVEKVYIKRAYQTSKDFHIFSLFLRDEITGIAFTIGGERFFFDLVDLWFLWAIGKQYEVVNIWI